ncbi:putative Coenzyme A disulfide reductase [Blattamonas nauphoetae]|uniref:Coenzyme A disulfide reductase n=1 Tax=Blattamonas nauphoetae TaxID=2049346 RepID=A0ABQ9Y9K0_9EUKA|nr:putative Coenzyme A disulfide reductase [Blattamonas nauphoetae]
MTVVIVGGVAGGASCAARLRRLDETAEIIMIDREPYVSYATCGLPYFISEEITDRSKLTLQTPQSFKSRFNIDVRVKEEVTKIDRTAKTVTVKKLEGGEEYTINYDKLVLSPGAKPIRPPLPGIENDRIFTLRGIPDADKIKAFIAEKKPKKAVVIGAGFIGLEVAEGLHRIGIEVVVIEKLDHVLGPFDFDMACDLHHHIRSKNVSLKLNTGVTGFVTKPSGIGIDIGTEVIDADFVLLSVGVRPESILAKEAGVALNPFGRIAVNENLRTDDEHIYAIGDAIEITDFVAKDKVWIPLAGPANRQGRIVADNLAGQKTHYSGAIGSSIVRVFDMTAGCVGLNERRCQALKLNYEKVFTYTAAHAGYFPGSTMMSVKLLFEKGTGTIYGAQIVGFEGIDKRLDVLATAIHGKMKVTDLTELELTYAPPFGSAKDVVNMVGYVAENVLQGKVEQFFWHDVKCLEEKKEFIIDVRTKAEYDNGHLATSVHLPLDSLRTTINEKPDTLPKDRVIYVHCQSGLRSYIACRMLTQKGYKCKNLAGGWRLLNSVTKEVQSGPSHQLPCGAKPLN